MPAQQLMVGWMGLSKQTAKGSPASTPATFGFGMAAGKVANVAIDQAPDPLTVSGTSAIGRNAPSASRTAARVDFPFTTMAYPRLIGLLLYGVSGTINSVGGTPNAHTITPGTTLPYLTSFGKKGNVPLWTKTQDCQVDELTISWDGRSSPLVASVLKGLAIDPAGSSFTWTNDESTTQYFVPPNALASYQLDVASATPAAAQVASANFHWSNGLGEVPLSKSVFPDDWVPGGQLLEITTTIIPNDYTDWIKVVSGSAAGHAIQATPVYGSFSFKLAIDANTDLTISASDKVAWTADLSDVDPGGGGDAITLTGQALGASAPWSVLLHNSTASY